MAKRIAVVNNEKLKDMEKKKYIQSLCPVNRAGTQCIYFEGAKLRIDEATCIGCGICVNAAPEAIKIINLPEALDKEPIHRYGQNAFALYNLPVPVFGKVVGVIGVNGIGKSTAINILAGQLKPNLGKLDSVASIQDLIGYFKGTEAQFFFEKVKAGQVKVAYKPQHVDMIPRQVDGNVIDLLKKVDETGRLQEIAEIFELTKVFDRSIKDISGGELQRLAVAATVLKKANLYIFDEVTSYLDIKQRLKVAQYIREMANDDTAVMVIEHDLIALDYMADMVHIMYGREGVFGIVSSLKPVKNGINTFLEGYLKEENVRFRDNKIKFDVKPPSHSDEKIMITQWGGFKKTLGSFSLKANPGEIKIKDRIGILGENGIGKTTFVKMLAGVEKPDDGQIDLKVNVAYKPQYLNNESEDLVMNVLQDAVIHNDMELIRPLSIKPLLLKKINELSGGELQRVAICLALSQKADIVLLDEPSAYLDVEQRLIVSKVISDVVELRGNAVLVVDHDLLFLDYLSQKLLVFEGEPSIKGEVSGPYEMEKGMNELLEHLKISLRRDEVSGRPRINKIGSVKDRDQKSTGKYYYS